MLHMHYTNGKCHLNTFYLTELDITWTLLPTQIVNTDKDNSIMARLFSYTSHFVLHDFYYNYYYKNTNN